MWYFFWMVGVGFALLLTILNALWGELEGQRKKTINPEHASK